MYPVILWWLLNSADEDKMKKGQKYADQMRLQKSYIRIIVYFRNSIELVWEMWPLRTVDSRRFQIVIVKFIWHHRNHLFCLTYIPQGYHKLRLENSFYLKRFVRLMSPWNFNCFLDFEDVEMVSSKSELDKQKSIIHAVFKWRQRHIA